MGEELENFEDEIVSIVKLNMLRLANGLMHYFLLYGNNIERVMKL